MDRVERARVLDTLETGWGEYIRRFEALSPQTQAAFLRQQGYARLGDLLEHVAAWWQLAADRLRQKQSGLSAAPVSIDVDGFNAQAVARVAGLVDAEVAARFETQRQAMLDLVADLPEQVYDLPDVQERLFVEVIEHLQEHRLP